MHGWDFAGHDKNPTPSNGLENSHGTHVAGIIAAEQNNGEGISGVCPDCQIMALRVGSASSLTLGRQIAAFEYAIDNGAQVINLSLGSPVWSTAERTEIAKAGRAGILVVVAAGNAGEDNDIDFYADPRHGAWAPSYPASYSLSNILSVAASNDRDHYAYFSQCQGNVPLWRCGFTSWGHDSVDVAAPGVDILSTVKVGASGTAYPNYDVWDGTSMATPMVAGIAGLVLSENPADTPVQVKNAIMNSVDHPSALTLYTMWGKATGVGTSALHGHFTRTQGRVNALGALTGATTSATPTTDGNIDGARSIDTRRAGKLVVARRRQRRLQAAPGEGPQVLRHGRRLPRLRPRPVGVATGHQGHLPVHDRVLPQRRCLPGAGRRIGIAELRRARGVPRDEDRHVLLPGEQLVLARAVHAARQARLTRSPRSSHGMPPNVALSWRCRTGPLCAPHRLHEDRFAYGDRARVGARGDRGRVLEQRHGRPRRPRR